MGFRSTFISDYWNGTLPEWFMEKYKNRVENPEGILICSPTEWKLYEGNEFFEDYQKALIETRFFPFSHPVTVVVLAEDGTITKVTITKDAITYTLMQDHYDHSGVWAQGF